MKDYIKNKHEVSFADERIQLALNLAYKPLLSGGRYYINKMFKLIPDSCINGIANGRSLKSVYEEYSVSSSYKNDTLRIDYLEGNRGLSLVVNYGKISLDMEELPSTDNGIVEFYKLAVLQDATKNETLVYTTMKTNHAEMPRPFALGFQAGMYSHIEHGVYDMHVARNDSYIKEETNTLEVKDTTTTATQSVEAEAGSLDTASDDDLPEGA